MSKIFKAVVDVFEVAIGAVLLAAGGPFSFIGAALLAAGLNGLYQIVNPRPKQGWRGDAQQISLSTDQPRGVVIGQTALAGSLVTWQTWGNNNEYVILLVALADHPCDSLVGAWWGGRRVTINSDGSVQDAYADGNQNLWLTFYNGAWDQAADSELISQSGGHWTTNDRGRGVCYVKIKARYNEKAHPNGLAGLFQLVFEIKGAHLYDRRQDSSVGGSGSQRANDTTTWTFSANAAVAAENLLRGFRAEDTTAAAGSRLTDVFFGLGLGDTDLPFAENVSAMNICDEPVAMKGYGANLVVAPTSNNGILAAGARALTVTSATGLSSGATFRIDAGAGIEERIVVSSVSGTTVNLATATQYDHANYAPVDWALSAGTTVTEPRYAANGAVQGDSTPETVLEDLCAAMAGKLLAATDRWVLVPGAARTPVLAITDGDIRIDIARKYTKDLPLAEIVNAVYGRFADPTQQYSPVALPARLSTADETEDGGKKDEHYDLNFVTSFTQGQRVLEIYRRRGRCQKRAQLALAPSAHVLEAADWVNWSSDRYGFDVDFEVNSASFLSDEDSFFTPQLDLAETNPQVYAWDPSVDELDKSAPTTLASADPTIAVVGGISIAPTTMSLGSEAHPALALTCNQITDPFCIGIKWEWRIKNQPAGAAATFTKTFDVNPAANTSGQTVTYTVDEGVIGAQLYEGRAIQLSKPDKAATFSSWTAAGANTAGSAVGSASAVPWTGVTGAGKPSDNATVGATAGVNLSSGGYAGAPATLGVTDIYTQIGTASAITGQGSLATASSVNLGTQVTGTLGTGNAASGLINSNVSISSAGVLSGAGGGTVTFGGLGGGAVGQQSTLKLGGSYLYQSNGTTALADATVVTSLGTASAITGQGSWATSQVTYATTAPGSPNAGDIWINTTATPYVTNRYSGSAWVAIGIATTNTSQLTDGANLGGTAVWTGVSSRPTELTDGRITTGFNSSGVLQTAIPSALANTSNLLRYSSGGLYTGELAADQTSLHTASAITGQGSLATASSVNLGTQVTGTLGTGNAASGLINSNVSISSAGVLSGAGGGTVTFGGLGGGAVGQQSTLKLGGSYLYQSNGTTALADATVVTSLGTASAITGQGSWATSQVTYATTAPGSPNAGDIWINTTATPYVTNRYSGSAWVAIGIATTNTSQLTDGANLGGTAVWTGVSSRPTELTDGRITTGFNSSGVLQTAIPSALANTSNLLRYSSGGLYTGELAADQTSLHTASAITGQGSLATASSVNLGTQVTGTLGTGNAASGLINSNVSISSAGVLSGAGGGTVTFGGLGGGAVGQQSTLKLGGSYLYQSNGTTALADATVVTSLGTASAITGQGSWATSQVTYATTAPGSPNAGDIWINTTATPYVTNRYSGSAWVAIGIATTNTSQLTDGANLGGTAVWTGVSSRPTELTDGRITTGFNSSGVLQTAIPSALANTSNLLRYSSGGLYTGELAADQTSLHTASAITGQGSLATASSVNLGTQVTGTLGTGNAASGLINSNVSISSAGVLSGAGGGTVTFGGLGGGAVGQQSTLKLGGSYLYQSNGTTALADATVVTSLGTASAITGQGSWATSQVTYATTAPGSPNAGDIWINTTATPYVTNRYSGSAWVAIGIATTNTSQLTDGANLGGTAVWTGVSSRPTELTDGRITTGFNSSGVLQTAIPSALANTSNLLRRTSGGLYTGELAADQTLLHTASAITGQSAWATTSYAVVDVVSVQANILFNGSLKLGQQGWTIIGAVNVFPNAVAIYAPSTAPNKYVSDWFAVNAYGVYTLSALMAVSSTGSTNSKCYLEWGDSSKTVVGTGTAIGYPGVAYTNGRQQSGSSPPGTAAYARVVLDGNTQTSGGFIVGQLFKVEWNSSAPTITIFTDEATSGALYRSGANIDALQPAEVGANVTATHTASAITGQGALATSTLTASQVTNANIALTSTGGITGAGGGSITALDFGNVAGSTKPANNATVGATTGTNLYSGTYGTLSDASVYTPIGTAAAIAGQGSLATASSVNLATQVTGALGTGNAASGLINSNVSISSTGVLSGAGGGSVTFSGLGGGAVGQQASLYYGDGYLKETNGGTTATLTNFKTSLGTASAITGQGSLATLSQITAANSGTYLGTGAVATTHVAAGAVSAIKQTPVTQILATASSTLKIGTVANVSDGDTLNIAGTTYTMRNSPSGAYDIQILTSSAWQQASFIAAAITGTHPTVTACNDANQQGYIYLYATGSGTGGNSNATTVATYQGSSWLSSNTAWSGGSASLVQTATVQYQEIDLSDLAVTINTSGGNVEHRGRMQLTVSGTATMTFFIKVQRTRAQTGMSSWADAAYYLMPGMNNAQLDFPLEFLDDQLNGVSGSVTYRYSLCVIGSMGGATFKMLKCTRIVEETKRQASL